MVNSEIEEHQAFLSHISDRIARPLPPDTTVLHAAISKLIGAPGRTAIDDDAASADCSDGSNGKVDRFGEDAALQSKTAAADNAAHFVEVLIGKDANDGAEHLVTNNLH